MGRDCSRYGMRCAFGIWTRVFSRGMGGLYTRTATQIVVCNTCMLAQAYVLFGQGSNAIVARLWRDRGAWVLRACLPSDRREF